MSNIEPFFHCDLSPTFHFNISAQGFYFPKEAYPLKSILVHKVAIGRFPFTKKGPRVGLVYWRWFRVFATRASLPAFQ